jgi:hypothetical protein
MTHFNHITAKGMPSMAGQRAPMLMSVGVAAALRRALERAAFALQGFASESAAMLGLSKSATLGYAIGKPNCSVINRNVTGFGYATPRHRYDNSPGKARIKLR